MDIKTLITELDISERLLNICKNARILTLEDLFKLDYSTLINFRGLGKKTIEEINSYRIRFGIEPIRIKFNLGPSNKAKDYSPENRFRHRRHVKYFMNEIENINYNELIGIKITYINFTNRLVNVLLRLGVEKISDIVEKNVTPDVIISQKNIGEKTLREYEYFYELLTARIPKINANVFNKLAGMDLLQSKQLSDMTISFPLYNVLNNMGVYKLKDILDLDIDLQKLQTQIGLRSKPAIEFCELLNKLKQEDRQLKVNFPELFNDGRPYFNVLGLDEKSKSMPIVFFMLPPVVDRFLENNQIQNFKELGSKLENQLIGLNPYIKKILNTLIQNLKDGNFSKEYVPRGSHYFPCWVDNFIENMKERDVEIFKLRYGFYNTIYTLEEIGKVVDLTRERTRQILSNLTKDFRRKFNLPLKHLELEFKEDIINRFKSLTEEEIFRRIDEEGLIKPLYPRQMYLHFLHELSPQILLEFRGKPSKTKFSSYEERVETRITKILQQRLPIIISKKKFRLFVQENSKIDIYSFLRVALMSTRIIIEDQNDNIKLALRRSTLGNGVNAIFNSLENPITISDFKKKLHRYFPNLKTLAEEEYIRGRLINHPKVFRLDTDLFGNAKHLETLCPNKNNIIDFCYLELDKRKIPTAIYDLVELIPSSYIQFVPHNPNFLIDAIISTDKRFVKLGRLLYGLKKWGKIELLNVADQAFKILKKNKVPMHFNELFSIVKQNRSVHEISLSTILRADKRFHNYSPSWYGLNEMHEENLIYLLLHSPYVDSLIYSQQPGTSLEEIIDALDMQDYFDVEELEEILTKDQRFIIYVRDGKTRVFHKNWFTRKLIAKILRDNKKGLDIQELQWKLNDLYGFTQKYSLKEIRNALSTMINIVRIDNRIVMTREIEISDNLKQKIGKFVNNNMADKTILYNLEEMFDLFLDVTEINEEELTYHHFKIGFEKQYKTHFVQIGSDIFRRTS